MKESIENIIEVLEALKQDDRHCMKASDSPSIIYARLLEDAAYDDACSEQWSKLKSLIDHYEYVRAYSEATQENQFEAFVDALADTLPCERREAEIAIAVFRSVY